MGPKKERSYRTFHTKANLASINIIISLESGSQIRYQKEYANEPAT
jgi:hypothetical protein